MTISVIIPAYNETMADLAPCILSVEKAIKNCPDAVEVILVQGVKGIGRARNCGSKMALGDVLVFMDSDCTMSENFLKEVYEKAQVETNLGGGVKYARFDRYSFSRIVFLLYIALFLYLRRISIGAFWIKREVFEAIHGFREKLEHLDGHVIYYDEMLDFDFALRLKIYAESIGCNFRSIKKSYITWSTRSFDKYGEWFWLKDYQLYQTGDDDDTPISDESTP